MQNGLMRLSRVRGGPRPSYLIRQPIAALIPAFPLASEAAPRKLSR